MTRRPILLAAAGAVAAAVLLAAGCGGGGNEGTTTAPAPAETGAPAQTGAGGGTTLELATDPGGGLEFDKTALEAPAGKISIVLTNESSVPHNVSIEGNGVDVEGETFSGGERTLTVTLEPGTYTFYCSVPGHRQAGMEGTLTVS